LGALEDEAKGPLGQGRERQPLPKARPG
jgi:hypothetical protein